MWDNRFTINRLKALAEMLELYFFTLFRKARIFSKDGFYSFIYQIYVWQFKKMPFFAFIYTIFVVIYKKWCIFKKGEVFMNYKPLSLYAIMNPDKDIKHEVENRRDGYGTTRTELVINPIMRGLRTRDKYNLFLVHIPEIGKLTTQVREYSQKIMDLVNNLPDVANDHFFLTMIGEEIKSTNDIEGVKSTTTEIEKAISVARENSSKNTRLLSFAKMYLMIQERKVNKIEEPKDIRELYDFLLDGEIAENKLPDGFLFRNSFVRIGTETKTVHRPKEKENDFFPDVKSWIDFVNKKDIDPLHKAAIAHYYFEYIHPFYDGNGRLGRYIFCSYIGKKIDPFTAISFSHEINQNKKNYYNSFEEVSNQKNYGEITFFVITILNYLVSGQKDVLGRLRKSNSLLNHTNNKLEESNFNSQEKSILFFLAQAKLFGDLTPGIEDRVLQELMKRPPIEYPKARTKRLLEELEAAGYIVTTKKKPIVRELTDKFFDEINFELSLLN